MTDAGIKETLNATVLEGTDGERVLNQYILKNVLGKGAYGTVYYAWDTAVEEPVAVKEFSKSKLRKQKLMRQGGLLGLRGRFRGRGRGGALMAHANKMKETENPIELVRGEIAIFKKLNHRNVVRLFEVLDDPEQDSLFMVFELCEKGAVMDVSLDKAAEPLPEEVARSFFRQIILGIEYLHEHDIAHRDIKPDNLLVAGDGTLKLVDFGVSEMFDPANDKLKTSAGSPAFFAPEVCTAHHGNISARAADIWAMGVTLFSMLFGYLPFNGQSVIDLYENIRTQPIPIPASTSPSARDLLLRLMEKDPSARITMDELRVHPWVTRSGSEPLPSKSENCVPVSEVTEEDIKSAVKSVSSLFTLLKAVSKLKRIRSRIELDAVKEDTI
ncbi:hypothetical protein HDU85_001362 [Gaertneriomyces sp. JEL0708]|nr:hypothetical protein HDU85_001362 [Gaertneriomyces sp. JEL0708]